MSVSVHYSLWMQNQKTTAKILKFRLQNAVPGKSHGDANVSASIFYVQFMIIAYVFNV